MRAIQLFHRVLVLAAFTAGLLLCGCGKSGSENIDASSPLGQVESALKAKDYEKAVSTLLEYQRQPLTAEEQVQAQAEMVKVQGAVAEAAAKDDPKAKAAANLLRAAAPRR
jgi:hypothetical protein